MSDRAEDMRQPASLASTVRGEVIAGDPRVSPASKRIYRHPFIEVARAAIKRGPLIKTNNSYTFGRRTFAPRIVNKLIASGEAVRIGNKVIARD